MLQVKMVLLLSLGVVPAAMAQQDRTEAYATPHRADVALGYNFIRANAPPGTCVCFQMNGGVASGNFFLTHGLSVAAEFTGGHASHISNLGQDLTLTTYTFGPRYTVMRGRLAPFAEALFGAGHASGSYFPQGTGYSTSATSFAFDAGGGLDVQVNRRFAVRAVEAQYLRTSFPNGSTNEQNHLMIGAGVVVKLGLHPAAPPPPPPPPPVAQARNDLAFWCSTNVMNVEPGQRLLILGNTMTEPNHLAVTYSWTVTGGQLEGTGREVSLDTTDLAPGPYRVTGHAVATEIPGLTASCDLSFRVVPRPKVIVASAPPPPPPPPAVSEKVFHENVKDALFDYDKSDLRPDTKLAINHAAVYLKQHPEMNVLVGGYSDERGSDQYNLALGIKRARVTRDALVADGVEGARIQIISYGKGQQVCTEKDEACFQQNRRAAFVLHP